ATVDLHANISDQMAEYADAIIGYDTYPHIDFAERGEEAARLLAATLRGEVSPRMVVLRPAMMPPVQKMLTAEPPMKELIELAHEAEQEQGVLTVTVAGGFPYADVEFAGMSAVVVTDGDELLARRIAERITAAMEARARAFLVDLMPVDEAVRRAMESKRTPVILVDAADNIGGGAPGDGTVVLEALLRLRAV